MVAAVALPLAIPEIDLDVVARYPVREDTPQTLREYEASLRA